MHTTSRKTRLLKKIWKWIPFWLIRAQCLNSNRIALMKPRRHFRNKLENRILSMVKLLKCLENISRIGQTRIDPKKKQTK